MFLPQAFFIENNYQIIKKENILKALKCHVIMLRKCYNVDKMAKL